MRAARSARASRRSCSSRSLMFRCSFVECYWLQRLAQPRESARGAALDRARRAAENVGDLRLGQVVEVAQDEHGALALVQLPKGLKQFGTRLERRHRVDCKEARRHLRLQLAAALRPAASTVERQVDQNPPGVRPGMLHATNAWPAPCDL